MSIKTNLKGRLGNTELPISHGMLPLFEAVVNSIHAIEESERIEGGRITINVKGATQLLVDSNKEVTEISSFEIIDNGIGFNDDNMKSFETLDSDYKRSRGCRGVGRLSWLKAFESVDIKSVYNDGSKVKSREFLFSEMGIGDLVDKEVEGKEIETKVSLLNIRKQFKGIVNKNPEDIAKSIIEHCLWYFIREGGAPQVILNMNENSYILNHLLDEYMLEQSVNEEIVIKGETFFINHIKFNANQIKDHTVSFCAADRQVKVEKLKIPGLTSKVVEDGKTFVYSAYVISEYLDEKVRPERTDFNINQHVGDLFEDSEISFEEIQKSTYECVREYLSTYLKQSIEKTRERLDRFASTKSPRYKSILSTIPDEELTVSSTSSDKELDLFLHNRILKIENELREEGHKIMNPLDSESEVEYKQRVKSYADKIIKLNTSDLAAYVVHRKTILDLLEHYLEMDEAGNYKREDLIHQLIIPMQTDTDSVSINETNLWILDDRLTFHHYLSSDRPFKSLPITGSDSAKEADIIALNINDNPLLFSDNKASSFSSLEVIEIKRPMRNDSTPGKKTDPIDQALDYLAKVREGKVKTKQGVPIYKSESIPGFCYIVADITPSIKKTCERYGYKLTSDGAGYFGYNDNYSAYVEVVSYQRLLNSAKERNRAFFDKLKLPVN